MKNVSGLRRDYAGDSKNRKARLGNRDRFFYRLMSLARLPIPIVAVIPVGVIIAIWIIIVAIWIIVAVWV